MYKGIVLKATHHYAVVLSESNAYYKIALKGAMQTGQKIYFFDDDILDGHSLEAETQAAQRHDKHILHNVRTRRLAYMAAVACLLVLAVFGALNLPSAPQNVMAVVSIDINPSIDLEIDPDSMVISTRTHNEEGKKIAGTDLIGLELEEAIIQVIQKAEDNNYLSSDGDVVLLAAAVNPDAQALNNDGQKIQLELDRVINKINQTSLPEKYNYLVLEADSETYAKAKNNDISVGKFEMAALSDGQLSTENVKSMNVKELIGQEIIRQKITDSNSKVKWNAESKTIQNKKDNINTSLLKQINDERQNENKKKASGPDSNNRRDHKKGDIKGDIKDYKKDYKWDYKKDYKKDYWKDNIKDNKKENQKNNLKDSLKDSLKDNLKDNAKDNRDGGKNVDRSKPSANLKSKPSDNDKQSNDKHKIRDDKTKETLRSVDANVSRNDKKIKIAWNEQR